MPSMTLGTWTSGPAVGGSAPKAGAVTSRGAASRAIAAASGPVADRSRREGVVETGRVLESTLAVYALLIALPLLLLLPIFLTGLFLGAFTTLFRGIV